MMEFYEAVERRRTVRDLLDKEVPEDVLKRIIGAGLKAPSNDHLRSWEFVVLRTEEEKKAALAAAEKFAKGSASGASAPAGAAAAFAASGEEIAPEVKAQRAMYSIAIPRQYSMLNESGCVILPFFKAAPPFAKLMKLELPTDGELPINMLNSFASIWCVIENIFLAAAAEGLATSMRIPVGDERNFVSQAVGAPEGWIFPCYIGLGWPKDDAERPPQLAPEASERIHSGKW